MLNRCAPHVALALAAAVAAAPAIAQELKETSFPNAARHQPSVYRTDTIKLTLAPAKDPRRRHETEYAVRMKPGDTLVYSLTMSKGAEVYHEFHGHDDDQVTFYKKETGPTHHGSLTAPFEGDHGWYLENRGAKPVSVVLKLSGFYEPPEE